MNTVGMLFGSITMASAFRVACPLILAAMGGVFCHAAGIFNFAYECFMLCGAFFGAYGSHLFGSSLAGALFSMGIGALLGAVFALLVFHLHADVMIVSLALNMGAWALTTLMLHTVFGTRGQIVSKTIINYPKIHFALLDHFPLVSSILNDNIWMVYFAYLMIIAAALVMYRTSFGLRLRGVGINPAAAQTAGVSANRIRWGAMMLMGITSGLAGSYLPMSGLNTFSENMTSGRGYIVFAAILVGNGNPPLTALICFIFAYTDALSTVLTALKIPTQLVSMIPYLAVIVTLLFTKLRSFRGKARIA